MVTGDNPNEVMGQKFKGPRSHLRGAGTFLHHAEISTEGLEFYTLTGHNQTEFLGSKFWNTFPPPPTNCVAFSRFRVFGQFFYRCAEIYHGNWRTFN